MLLNTLIYTIDVEKGFNNNTKNGEKILPPFSVININNQLLTFRLQC